ENKNQELHYFLHVFDVATPTDPKDLGKLPYQPVLVTEFDHYAVLRQQFTHGNWPAGVEIVDMLFPDSGDISFAPVQIAEIVNMTVVGKRAYATTIDNNFLVLDISRIENPIPVVRYNLGGQGQLNYGISVVDNYAYIIVRDVGMRILNISDEADVKEVGTYKMESIPVELTAKEQYVYIAEWYGNLEIVDVSDPAQPTRIGVYDAGDRINKMHIRGNYLFMSTGPSGLQVLDISDPVSPFLVSSFVTGTYTTGVDINCQYIYVSDIENGLFVLKSNLLPAENCD
ncbi:MAG TPA: hypothetical protein VFQ13_24080, partial [Anaerolineales bacterium]|nr:hypothetical protein [Anaerolineales bacterium]